MNEQTYQIKHRITGKVLFEAGVNSLKTALEIAVSSRAKLDGAKLDGANLDGANLGGAKLSRAKLSRANLSRANLSGANLSRASLSGASLSGASLSGAYLSGAYLSGADLIDGGQDSRGYRFIGQHKDNTLYIHAGCRYFPITEAEKHWKETHPDNEALHDECCARVKLIKELAKARGWIK